MYDIGRWMLYVELLLPWLNGAASYLFPAIGTSRIINGMCLMVSFWPSDFMDKVRRYYLSPDQTALESIGPRNNNNNTRVTALFRDNPGEPVPERKNQSGFY